MKKIFTAVLAVAMMSSIASASLIGSKGDKDAPVTKNPRGSIKIGYSDFRAKDGDSYYGIDGEVDFTDGKAVWPDWL